MMRIAYVCLDRGARVFGSKGSSIHIREVIRGLSRRGAIVELFAPLSAGEPPPGLEETTVHWLPRGLGADTVAGARAALRANEDLHRALREAGPFDLIYERHSLFGYAGMEHAQSCGIPGLLEVNAPLIQEQRRYRHLVLEKDAQRAAERAFAAASCLLAVSDGVARYLDRHPAARDRVQVVPNGVDPRRFSVETRPALGHPERSFTVGFVGTLKPWHGVRGLIEAFAALRRSVHCCRLLIVGEGPQRRELQRATDANGLSAHIHFTGAVAPQMIPDLLATMDVAVAPYPPMDGFYFSPLKLFEYMAASRAIVAAGIGQINDVLTDGVNALLYRPGDVAAMTRALKRLSADGSLRRRLGSAARQQALSRHTWDAVAARILKLARIHSSAGVISWQVG